MADEGETEHLFDFNDEEEGLDLSDDSDSFIVGTSENEDSVADEYEFLFGPPKVEKKDRKNKKSVNKRAKELERLLRQRHNVYDEFERPEDEIDYTVRDLDYHWEQRNALESEILSLFAGLLTREQFAVDSSTSHDEPPPQEPLPEPNRLAGKLLKKLIKQTFSGRIPEGRFGSFGKNVTDSKEKADGPKLSTVVTIGREALVNLRDLNTLMNRERGSDYEELNGIALYKHPRSGTLYIYNNNFIQSHIIPLCSNITRGSYTDTDLDIEAIVKEVIYLLYQLSQPPSKAWFNYWTEAQKHYMDLSNSKTIKDEGMLQELKLRSRVVLDYLNGLKKFRQTLCTGDVWNVVGDFRMKLENFKNQGFRSIAQKNRCLELERMKTDLSSERDLLIKDHLEDTDDEEEKRTRLRHDKSLLEEKRAKLHDLKKRILQVSNELSKEHDDIAIAERQTLLHIQTVRILVINILIVPGNDTGTISLLNDCGLLALLKNEIISTFDSCKKGFIISEGGEIEPHAAYLSEQQRAVLWEYVRLIHSIFSCISIRDLFKTATSKDDFIINKSQDDVTNRESFANLARLNPKLARLKLRTDVDKFNIDERLGQLNKKNNYDRLFRFPSPKLKTPFDVYLASPSSAATISNPKSLRSELHSIIGIDSEFEHCHWNSDNFGIYYELGLLLSLCYSDVSRETDERYMQPCDVEVLMDLHTWIVTYYRCLYKVENDIRLSKNLDRIPEAFLLLSLRRYIGNDNLMAKVTASYVWRLIRKESMRKLASIGATCALRSFYADLTLVYMLSSENLHVTDICKHLLASYLSYDIRAAIFWILRFFKHTSHHLHLFTFALSSIHLLNRVVKTLGPISFSVERTQNRNIGFGYDSDSDEYEGVTKLVTCNLDSVFTSRNRNKNDDDILYNGRVAYNCVILLASYRTNSSNLNDLLISHLEMVPIPVLFDAKYFFVFYSIVNDRRVWQNAHWRWIGEFCMHIFEQFFDKWLCLDNKFLPIELLFNKTTPSTIGPFRPCSKEHITPVLSNYSTCPILRQLTLNDDISIYEIIREVHGTNAWSPEDDNALLKYYKRFSFLDDPHSYVAELLGRPVEEIRRRLGQLDVIGDTRVDTPNEGRPSGGLFDDDQPNFIRQYIKQLRQNYAEAPQVLNELYDNINESIEMKRLGGTDVICEVMEPLSASQKLLNSKEFRGILHCLALSSWLLPNNFDDILPLLEELKNVPGDVSTSEGPLHHEEVPREDGFTSNSGTIPGSTAEVKNKTGVRTDTVISSAASVSSRDIARLVLQVCESGLDGELVKSIINESLKLMDSARVLGRVESVCELLPDSNLEQLSQLLKMANIRISPPLLICEHNNNITAARDRLNVALNLYKLPLERLKIIASTEGPSSTHSGNNSSINGVSRTTDDASSLAADLRFTVPGDHFRAAYSTGVQTSGNNLLEGTEGELPEEDDYMFDDMSMGEAVYNMKGNELVSFNTLYKLYKRTLNYRGRKLDPVLSEVYDLLMAGVESINMTDVLSLGSENLFKNWDESFNKLRNLLKSLGATESFQNDTLHLQWQPEAREHTLEQLGPHARNHKHMNTADTSSHPIERNSSQRSARINHTSNSDKIPRKMNKQSQMSANPAGGKRGTTSRQTSSGRLATERKRKNTAALSAVEIGVKCLEGTEYDLAPFRKLESAVDLVTKIHTESLMLATQKKLVYNITQQQLKLL